MAGVGNERKKRTKEELESEIYKKDCFETPPWTMRALLLREPKLCYSEGITDPTSGRGQIVRELKTFRVKKFAAVPHIAEDMAEVKANKHGLYVRRPRYPRTVGASDIRTDDYIEGIGGIDFLEETHIYNQGLNGNFSAFCYNPPFGPKGNPQLGVNIVRRSLELVRKGGIVAVLQRLPFLESKGRYERLFRHGHLRRIYQFTIRIQFYPEGQINHLQSGKAAYAWFVFLKGWKQPPEMLWIADTPADYGEGALLPQQWGLCEWCRFHEKDHVGPVEYDAISESFLDGCNPTVDRYPEDHPTEKLRGKRRWTKDKECEDGDERFGVDMNHLCGGWGPRL